MAAHGLRMGTHRAIKMLSPTRIVPRLVLVPAVLLGWAVDGCRTPPQVPDARAGTSAVRIEAVDLSVPSRVEVAQEPVRLRTPRDGWSDFTVRVSLAGGPVGPALRLPAFARGGGVAAASVYQVLSAPVDFDTAAYVRQSGEAGRVRRVPRVLLSLPVGADGTVDLTATRTAASGPAATALLWVDVRTPATAPPGDTSGTCDLLDGPTGAVVGSIRVTLSVADVTLPANRHLRIAAPLDGLALGTVAPRLLSRHDPACAAAVAALDQYVRLAHGHRADVFVARLQPIVKWPSGRPPAVDWIDFDGVAGPWLDGSAFPDHRPVGFWPLPAPDALEGFDLAARSQYWAEAADHFGRRDWGGGEHPVLLRSDAPGPVTEAGQIILSAEARAVLDAAPAATAMVPLRAGQVPLASASNPSLVTPAQARRLLTRTAGGVRWSDGPVRATAVVPAATYLDAGDGSAFHGTGDEEDVRAAAWLAFLRGATLLRCGRPRPTVTRADQPVPADELPWFYPGDWFGAQGPLPTLQLKWLRQAEQDYEVLRLSADAGDRDAALAVCRLVAKPVEASGPAGDVPPSEASLLGGSTTPHACADTRDLLMDRLASRRPRSGAALTQIDLTTVRWFNAHQRPTAFATAVDWTWADAAPDLLGQTSDLPSTGPGRWITARVKVDVYDPADPAADGTATEGARPAMWNGNTLQWRTAGGWEPRPPVSYVPAIPACGVRAVTALARFNLEQAMPAPPITASGAGEARPPLSLSLLDRADGQSVDCPLVLPVATCDRLTRPVTLDGALDDWYPTDAALLDRPLVRMASRPAVQAGEARPADHPSTVYSGWDDDGLYVAFRVGGLTSGGVRSARNFVEYRDGRAWGEDLCEVTVQPVYVDDSVGPTLHVVCKTGGEWVERQSPDGVGGWQPFEGTALRYAATVDPAGGTWRGELAIPWKSLTAAGRGRPSLLRFNFGQHVNATGESATWAGPVDQSRQAGMAGLLVLRNVAR